VGEKRRLRACWTASSLTEETTTWWRVSENGHVPQLLTPHVDCKESDSLTISYLITNILIRYRELYIYSFPLIIQ